MDTATAINHAQTPLPTAARVPPSRRRSFLPKYFGPRLMMRGENLVYSWIRHLCKSYNGAYWHFYELPNGGFYLAPDLSETLKIAADDGFEDELSSDAAGIVVTLYALGQLAAENVETEQGDLLAERYHLLRSFASSHAEWSLIRRAID
jgi:uncharacterized protein YyaL (SSP411 family)